MESPAQAWLGRGHRPSSGSRSLGDPVSGPWSICLSFPHAGHTAGPQAPRSQHWQKRVSKGLEKWVFTVSGGLCER